MLRRDIRIETQSSRFYKGGALDSNSLNVGANRPFLIMLRNPAIFYACDFNIVSEQRGCIGSFSTKLENSPPFLYPSEVSTVMGGSSKGIAIAENDAERFLYIQKGQDGREEYIEGGSLIYINGLVKEIYTGRAGSLHSSNNYSYWEGRRYALRLEGGDWLEITNLSVYCVHDIIFTSFAIWRIYETYPEVQLRVYWEGNNGSYQLINEIGFDPMSYEYLQIIKYYDGHSSVLRNVSRDGHIAVNWDTWNSIYLNLMDGNFYYNTGMLGNVYDSFTDNESERWIRKVSFYNAGSDPVYLGDILIINLPSSSEHFLTQLASSSNRSKIHNILATGNFYWEI